MFRFWPPPWTPPTLKFCFCFNHFWCACNMGRFSLTQRAQNLFDKMWTCFHLAWNLSESSNSQGHFHSLSSAILSSLFLNSASSFSNRHSRLCLCSSASTFSRASSSNLRFSLTVLELKWELFPVLLDRRDLWTDFNIPSVSCFTLNWREICTPFLSCNFRWPHFSSLHHLQTSNRSRGHLQTCEMYPRNLRHLELLLVRPYARREVLENISTSFSRLLNVPLFSPLDQ